MKERNKRGDFLNADIEKCAKSSAEILDETEETRDTDIRLVFQAVKGATQEIIRDCGEQIPFHISSVPADMDAIGSVLKIMHILRRLFYSGYIEVAQLQHSITMTKEQLEMDYALISEIDDMSEDGICADSHAGLLSYNDDDLARIHCMVKIQLRENLISRISYTRLEQVTGKIEDIPAAMKILAARGYLSIFSDGGHKFVFMTPEQLEKEFE